MKTFSTWNKILKHPKFEDTLQALKELHPTLASVTEFEDAGSDWLPNHSFKVESIGKIEQIRLDAKKGIDFGKSKILTSYDESIKKINCLEGIAFFTSHALILMDEKDYLPANLLTFYFYTRSQEVSKKSSSITYSQKPEQDSRKHYFLDRIEFQLSLVPNHSLLLIDGPIIGGDFYTEMIQSIEKFHEKNVIPVFFVKNSSSNLVTDNVNNLKNKYDSDLHWSYDFLKQAGTRTNYFKYEDQVNPKNTKVFSYIKAYQNVSPQRIEFHTSTFQKYVSIIDNIMDLIYYFILVQGDKRNPQVRPIAIAEKFARDALKCINIEKRIKETDLILTMNEVRFGN